MVAMPAAIATGLPAMVEPWLPGGQVMISRGAIIAPSGIPEAIPLATQQDVGDDAGVLGGEHLAGAPHAALHLVEHQQDAVQIAERAQPRQEVRRRHDVAPFAQHRLDDDGRDVLGRRHRGEQLDDAVADRRRSA